MLISAGSRPDGMVRGPGLRHRLRRTLVVALLGLVCAVTGARAEDCVFPEGAYDVLVGIRDSEPFVYDDPVRGQTGLGIELWEAVSDSLAASGMPVRSAYVTCSLGNQMEALADSRLDLVISPLTITADRMDHIDFTVQYLTSGLTVVKPRTGAIDFRQATRVLRDTVLQPGTTRAILIFLVANLVIGLLALRLLRNDVYGGSPDENRLLRPLRFILESIVRTLGLKGLGDKFASFSGRILEISMAIIGTILSATVFGVLTSAFTSAIGGTTDVAPRSLADHTVVTLVDSTSQRFIEAVHAEGQDQDRVGGLVCAPLASAGPATPCLTVEAWDDAIDVMLAGRADFVVGDWVQLSFLARQPRYSAQVQVQSRTYLNEPYGWGVAPDRTELRDEIDKVLVAKIRNPYWRPMIESYLGSGSISPE